MIEDAHVRACSAVAAAERRAEAACVRQSPLLAPGPAPMLGEQSQQVSTRAAFFDALQSGGLYSNVWLQVT